MEGELAPRRCGLRPRPEFGPDDSTAVGAVVDASHCCVHDRADRLSLAPRSRRAALVHRAVAQLGRLSRPGSLPQHGCRTDARPRLRPRRGGPVVMPPGCPHRARCGGG
ncbi:hypothetical protein ACRAWF_38475 [Streptomyces sp. L7]